MTRRRQIKFGAPRIHGFALAALLMLCSMGRADDTKAPPTFPSGQSQEPGTQTAATPNNTQNATRTVSWKTLFPNIANDQREIWTFPVSLAKGNHWKPTLAVSGITAGLVALDPHVAPYFRRTNDFSGFNDVFSGTTTSLGIAIVPVSFYLIGLKRHDPYAQQTGLFAAESLADAIVLSTVIKGVTRRTRPRDVPPNGDFSHTWFKTGWGSSFSGDASFPSGHTIAAFSVATIVARRYGSRHRWVPWVAYGLASLVGFSRVTGQAHFPADVFMGAALGYSISRFAVLHQ